MPLPNSFSVLNGGLIQSFNLEKGEDPIRITWMGIEESIQVIAFWLEVSSWKGKMWLERSIKDSGTKEEIQKQFWSHHRLASLPGLRSEHSANHLRAGKLPASAKDTLPYLRQPACSLRGQGEHSSFFIFRWTDLSFGFASKCSFALIPNILICALICHFKMP